MKLKLACADFTFPLLAHQQALQIIAALGFKGVDIGLFEDRSHLQPSDQFKRTVRSARTLKKRLDDNGLVVADLFLQLALDYQSQALNHPSASVRQQARDAFFHTLDYAGECRARHITALPGVHFPEESRNRSVGRSAEELAWRVEQARARRVTFAIEPHIGSFANTPARTLQLLAATPGLTLTLDYGHFVPRGHNQAKVDPLLQHTSHFHARGVNRGSGGCSLGDNTLDWPRVFALMDQAGYRGWIELEYGGNNITDTVELSSYFRTLVG